MQVDDDPECSACAPYYDEQVDMVDKDVGLMVNDDHEVKLQDKVVVEDACDTTSKTHAIDMLEVNKQHVNEHVDLVDKNGGLMKNEDLRSSPRTRWF